MFSGVLPLPEISNTIIIFQEDNTQLQSTCTGDKLPCFFDVGWFLNTSRVTNTTASGGTTYFYNSTITVRVPPDINSTMLQCCVEYQFTMGGDLTTECRNVTGKLYTAQVDYYSQQHICYILFRC